MLKIKYKIFVLFILVSSVLTVEGGEFFHNHETCTDSHCISCLISGSLIAVKPDVSVLNKQANTPEFKIAVKDISLHTQYNPTSLSDRAPPID